MSDPTPDPLQLAVCPSCGTTDKTTTYGALSAGDSWLCARCGQRWTASRLATVAAYAAWVTARAATTSVARESLALVGEQPYVPSEELAGR